jgi:hypothetical protein
MFGTRDIAGVTLYLAFFPADYARTHLPVSSWLLLIEKEETLEALGRSYLSLAQTL